MTNTCQGTFGSTVKSVHKELHLDPNLVAVVGELLLFVSNFNYKKA